MGASNFELVFISSTWDCTTFHNFLPMFKKKNQKLAGLWLAGEVVNHVRIYGSKAAEGLSAFQRRSCFWLEGFRIKASSKSIVNQSQQFMNVDENGSVANAFVQNMAFFLSGKVKMTIREAGQSLESTTLTSHITWQVLVLASSYLHLHMIWIIEHGCVEVNACGQNTSQKLALSS